MSNDDGKLTVLNFYFNGESEVRLSPEPEVEPEPERPAGTVPAKQTPPEDNAAAEEWHAKRAGKITCSQFGSIMSSGRKKDDHFSQTGLAYLRQKVAERMGSRPPSMSSASTRWGTDNEAEALRMYGLRTQSEVTSGVYQFFDWGSLPATVGGTPDALVGDDGCVEVKCPHNPAVHVNTLLTREIPAGNYFWQCVGHCLVTQREWCDFVSYDPRVVGPQKIIIIRWERDEQKITELTDKLKLAEEWICNAMKSIGR